MPSAQGHITVRRRARNGSNGTGVSITSQSTKYASSTSGTAHPTSGWQNTVPSVAQGLYLWTWVHVTYSDNTTTDMYSVSRMGIDGKGIKSSTVTYCQKADTNKKPEDFAASDWGAFPTSLTDGYWLYTRTHIIYSDNAETDSYSVSQIGVGAYYAGTSEYYTAGTSPTDEPNGAPTPGTYVNGQTISTTWKQERPTLTAEAPYLWNFEISADSRGNRYVTDARCIGNFARGIVSIVESYAISAYGSPDNGGEYPSDIASTDWQDEQHAAAPTDAKRYQWNRTVVTYNDGADTFYHVSAVRGLDGKGAAYIDIDNDNDSIMYDGAGTTRIGGAATSALRFYDNGELKSGITFAVYDWSLGTITSNPYISGTTLYVPEIKTDSGYVTVRCLYNSVYYYGRMTVKRLVGTDKYDIVVSPNAITYNEDDPSSTVNTVKIEVFRTAQNGTRTLVPKLSTYNIKLRYTWSGTSNYTYISDGTTSTTYNSGVTRTIYPDLYTYYRYEVLDANNNVLDFETVTIGHIKNGEQGRGISSIVQYWLATSKKEGVTINTTGWTTDPQTTDETNRYLWYYETITYTDGKNPDTFGPAIIGVFGQTGYGIVTSVTRNNFTEAQWATYGTVGHTENWSDTSSIRNGARVGDLFTVVGKATDTGNGHTATYRCTNASGNLVGICISHVIAEAGEDGDNGIRYWLEPNVREIKRYHTGQFSSSYVTCAKRKQEGKGAIETASDAIMSYTYTNGGSDTTVSNYSGGTVYIGLFWTKIVFKLTLNGVEVAKETILIEDVANSVGENLLNGTNFEDEADGGTTFASNKSLVKNSLDGQTALQCIGTFANAANVDFFRQCLIRTGDIRLQAATWYTLSYWAIGESYVHVAENITSASYGFAQESFYAIAGEIYTLHVNGYCLSGARSENRELRTFVYNDDWSWSQSNATTSTTATTFSVSFTVPTTGTYKISSYVYPNLSGGTGTVRVNWYRLYRERKMSTFVYPSVIDTAQPQVQDGTIKSSYPSDGNSTLNLTTGWVKHTFTFKTKTTLPTTEQALLFRIPPGMNGARICKVKLERGVFATEWCRSERDKQGLSYRLICKDSIQEGSEGCNIQVMMNYGERSRILTFGECTAKGLTVTGTNVEWNDTDQHLYLASGAAVGSVYRVYLRLNNVVIDQKDITVTPKGANGLAGCIQRVSEWVTGVEFRNDEGLTSGTRYLDIAIVTKSATSFDAYKCLKTHTATSAIPVTNTNYWQKFNSMAPIYTPMIMAQNALLRFTQTNQLLVMKSDGATVAAGMGGGNYPLWVGGTTPDEAPFKVSIEGYQYSTKGFIGSWVIGNNSLISQLGTLNGQSSYDYDNESFIPNIALDAIKGEIVAGKNMKINGDGLMLYNGNKICAKIVNQSIASEISETPTSGSDTINKTYSTTAYRPTTSRFNGSCTWVVSQNFGYLYSGATIRLQNASFTLSLPTSSGGVLSWNQAVTIRVRLSDGTIVASETYTRGSSTYISRTLTFNKTINIGSEHPEMNYTVYYEIIATYVSEGQSGQTASSTMRVYDAQYTYYNAAEQLLLIGSNGVFNRQSSTVYFMSTNYGFKVRYGNYMLEVGSNGIRKSTNGGANWNTL